MTCVKVDTRDQPEHGQPVWIYLRYNLSDVYFPHTELLRGRFEAFRCVRTEQVLGQSETFIHRASAGRKVCNHISSSHLLQGELTEEGEHWWVIPLKPFTVRYISHNTQWIDLYVTRQPPAWITTTLRHYLFLESRSRSCRIVCEHWIL